MSKQTDVEKIKHLRESTGLSFNEIKKALDEAGGDETRAVEILRIHGVKMAEKKSSREVKEGVVASYVHATKKLGSMVEVFCETDFVAKNAAFQELAKEIAMHIAAMKPGDISALLAQPYVKDQDITVKDLISSSIAKLGENIQVGRFELFEI
ncbi:MAG: translation elongation factor Ts [Candidatus Yanofskybacteria bacterium RIFCSPLOWO2_02_FULL_43_10]|uniref:Elongation factor Ts n=2 Tax=Parcubacteria group TaxID=1794811 RepID=A0A1G2RPN4_9BACT|nr:MAG: translation elongation factor Ts [Candidatus Yanofskybacteria bacterium RIFCSPHIGHO2_01_FULL_43_32]OGN10748.1 MAG: translation elongation factor Ts [Candidatus Yanofskybacteria bacterium RIFCSPHIGHO2_02_FULL_43_12]OGN17358.1 MAG: translation elongation factor Ts [Candidatus Yanofskybacteria bacterium RIFCSPHIGHO2_12_FULL_43_11]OGN29913.1 MAG: translation elongation factor Ts [Candidatus Yanofskybacteria bacterium RIFCSPLOWO2_02_FULL_43_10]OGN34224.1 MAG: translation elongation factor Ts